ncbi:hypothetical protein BDV38DRAFT_241867, partial [Aspergillus pseudotamarii]
MGYMNQPKFMMLYTYALGSDFQSPDSEPAAWAPGHPFRQGQELDKIHLGGSRVVPVLESRWSIPCARSRKAHPRLFYLHTGTCRDPGRAS